MANSKLKVAENSVGAFFVDSTCIDCGTCQHLAPQNFRDAGEHSFVVKQPQNEEETLWSARALLSCPTGSIGSEDKLDLATVKEEFPLNITENIYYLGFTSAKSYGASSYFIQKPDGNWLIDSPKFLKPVVDKLKSMGGVKYVFLTHSDDVADAKLFAHEFGAQRIIHQEELWSEPDAEIALQGFEATQFSEEIKFIPVPGHTKGSTCLLYKNKFLFSGDHTWWSFEKQELTYSFSFCNDTEALLKSHQKLLQEQFQWVFPGHGAWVNLKEPRTL